MCAPGYFCPSNSTTTTVCPVNFFCPAGSAAPTPCPPGTFGSSTLLTNSLQCTPCPNGQYCAGDGTISGTCSAGYLCYSAVPAPNPSVGLLNFLGITQNWNNDCNVSLAAAYNSSCPIAVGGLCPMGFYCTSGRAYPCANGTYMPFQGASLAAQCLPCPPGGLCQAGTASPQLCPTGYYCFGNQAISCPPGTYGPSVNQTNITACVVCPAGFFCNLPGISDYSMFPCPANHFCPRATGAPLACPPGTYSNQPGARTPTDCSNCSSGFYCPVGNTSIPCPQGYYCPAGSVAAAHCIPGFYCPPQVGAGVACPPGYYCPNATALPVFCTSNSYCPAYSLWPTPCPAGTSVTSAVNRTSLAISCLACPAGSFSNNTSSAECFMCAPGYICSGGASSPMPSSNLQGGYICPQVYIGRRVCVLSLDAAVGSSFLFFLSLLFNHI